MTDLHPDKLAELVAKFKKWPNSRLAVPDIREAANTIEALQAENAEMKRCLQDLGYTARLDRVTEALERVRHKLSSKPILCQTSCRETLDEIDEALSSDEGVGG